MVELFEHNNQDLDQVSINDVPTAVLQTKILCYFSSKDLFMLRGVNGEWSDSIKVIWCHVVKEEMLEQVHSLDLLYEKETTAKLLEFKIKYLVSYATLMRNYFINMNFEEIIADLLVRDDQRGKQILLVSCMIVAPNDLEYPKKVEEITNDHIQLAIQFIGTQRFKDLFTIMCQMESIPEINLQQMKTIKSEFMEKIVTQEVLEQLGNAARLLSSWIDGALEYTILKHEVIVLRLKNNKVLNRIREISSKWPKKKEFIEGAYKLLLFTKTQRKQINITMQMLQKYNSGMDEFLDFRGAINRVLKKWYEQRIEEETERNKKLRQLHDNLTRIKVLKEEEAMKEREAILQRQNENKQLKNYSSQENDGQDQELSQNQKDEKRKEEELQNCIEKKRQLDQQIENIIEQIKNTEALPIDASQQQLQQQNPSVQQIESEQSIQPNSNNSQEEEKESFQSTQIRTQNTNESTNPNVQNQNQRESQQSLQDQQRQQTVFSSQLLSQILSVGTLFTQKALLDEDEKNCSENEDGDYGCENCCGLIDQEQLRKEIYETLLKRRIFYSDRIEKLEKILVQLELIPKDTIYCSSSQLGEFVSKVQSENQLEKIFNALLQEKEEIWFDIYRSISPNSSEQLEQKNEKYIKRQKRLERLKKYKQELKNQRIQLIDEAVNRRIQTQQERPRQRRSSDSQIQDQNNIKSPVHQNNSQAPREQQTVQNQMRLNDVQNQENNEEIIQYQQQEEQLQNSNDINSVIVGLTAIRYLLDTAIQVAQRRQIQQRNQENEEPSNNQSQQNMQDMAIQTMENFQEQQEEEVNEEIVQVSAQEENEQEDNSKQN